eukprot:TRINITY_DN28105_c0_g1_i1.p1 TRINITY_DN28105_c0_g1~~TRINITY_DN28105_c0_g1_i1.p1  ORF type:complete len:444 (-),score=26.73 TRINITY_DN28105_c0_g1_i1:74-1405(-)
MLVDGQEERLPIVLDVDVEDMGGTTTNCSRGRARNQGRIPVIVAVCLLVSFLASALARLHWTQTKANVREYLHDPVELSSISQPNVSIVAAKLLGTVDVSQVMEHVHGRRSWGATLPGAHSFLGTVFYPFSGADVLSAVPLFPHASSLVLAALHQVGECQTSSCPDLHARSEMVSAMMQGVFVQFGGYFGTEEMLEHFDDTGYGVTPFLLASLSLLGEEPMSIDCGPRVGPKGTSLGLAPGKAVRILHRNKASGVTRELIYACVDLLSPSFGLNNFLLAMRQQAPLVSMLKATAYIIRQYEDNMLNRRPGTLLNSGPIVKLILEASQAILQDDSGVRVSCLGGWSLYFWGTYIGPAWIANMTMNISSDYDDSLRAQWCRSGNKRPLLVRFGYPVYYQISGCPAQVNPSCNGLSVFSGDIGGPKSSIGFATYAVRNSVVRKDAS